MEALAAIALAGNILQFVETTKKIISSSRQIALLGASGEHQELSTIARELQDLALRVTPPEPLEGAELSREEKSICVLGEQCTLIAQEFLHALDSLKAKNKDGTLGRFDSFYKALLGVWKQPKIDALLERLDRIRASLQMHLTTYGSRKILFRVDQLVEGNYRLEAHRTLELDELRKEFQTTFDNIGKKLDSNESRNQTTAVLLDAATKGSRYAAEQAILEHLRFGQINDRHNIIRAAHEQTFTWLFSTGEQRSPATFDEWLVSDDDLYWISGKPGSGKSTLMKFLCNHQHTLEKLNAWAKAERLIVAEFFFWNAGTSLQKSQEGLLRSIVYQILRQCPELIPQAYASTWRVYFTQEDRSWRAANPAISPPALMSLSVQGLLDTLRMISTVASDSRPKFCFFIDGLDEYHGHPKDMIDLIRLLRTLPNLKLCLSSRSWNEFEQEFDKVGTRKLYMEDFNSDDISAYVHDTFAKDENYQELEDKDMYGNELVEEIVKAANGVFLWVFLVVRSFQEGLMNGDRVLDLRNRLNELPTDLNDYFERILLSDVTERYRGQSAEMFSVILEGLEDIPVMAYWFMGEEDPQYALKLEVRPLSLQQVNLRLKTMKKRLNACCKGLLEVRHAAPRGDQSTLPSSILFDWKVSFLHRTVRDFLMLKDTRRLLERWCSPQFEPHEAVCKALLAQIKISPDDNEYWTMGRPVQKLYSSFMWHFQQLPVQGYESITENLHKALDMVLKLRDAKFMDEHWQPYHEPSVNDGGGSTKIKSQVSQMNETSDRKGKATSWWSKLQNVWAKHH